MKVVAIIIGRCLSITCCQLPDMRGVLVWHSGWDRSGTHSSVIKVVIRDSHTLIKEIEDKRYGSFITLFL